MAPKLTHDDRLDALQRHLGSGPQTSAVLQAALGVSQPTLSRLLRQLGQRIVRIGAARAARYALWDTFRGLPDMPIYRITRLGQVLHIGDLIPVRPSGYVMRQTDGLSIHSDGLPWWLTDMRPQGFLGRAYAMRHANTLGLPSQVTQWSDADALRALLAQGHDAVGNLLLGDVAYAAFLAQPPAQAVGTEAKGRAYAQAAELAMAGDVPGSSAAGEQPKFLSYTQTAQGVAGVMVKFSLLPDQPVSQRWRDLLLAEHHALTVLRAAGIPAARTEVVDHAGQRFLEVERFDRVGATGRLGLVSLAALDGEFVGQATAPWPLLVAELVAQKVVQAAALEATQSLFAFGKLIGNTDMHTGNLSFLNDGGRPYALAPAYDMLPMAFAPGSGGALRAYIPPPDLHPSTPAAVWKRMLPVAEAYLATLQAEPRFSDGFAPCLCALKAHLQEAARQVARLATGP